MTAGAVCAVDTVAIDITSASATSAAEGNARI
jgi:hypothetical protein